MPELGFRAILSLRAAKDNEGGADGPHARRNSHLQNVNRCRIYGPQARLNPMG